MPTVNQILTVQKAAELLFHIIACDPPMRPNPFLHEVGFLDDFESEFAKFISKDSQTGRRTIDPRVISKLRQLCDASEMRLWHDQDQRTWRIEEKEAGWIQAQQESKSEQLNDRTYVFSLCYTDGRELPTDSNSPKGQRLCTPTESVEFSYAQWRELMRLSGVTWFSFPVHPDNVKELAKLFENGLRSYHRADPNRKRVEQLIEFCQRGRISIHLKYGDKPEPKRPRSRRSEADDSGDP